MALAFSATMLVFNAPDGSTRSFLIYASDFKLTEKDITLSVDEMREINVLYNGAEYTGVTWTSENPEIATVDEYNLAITTAKIEDDEIRQLQIQMCFLASHFMQ